MENTGCDLDNNTWLYQQLREKKWCLIILYIVPIASAVVALHNFILLWKKKMGKGDCRNKTENLLALQFYDSYLEALPQLTLQLFIVLNNVEQVTQDTSFINMLRWCSMAMSAVTVARVQYSFATRNADYIGVVEAATVFISTLFLVVSRVFILSMGLTVTPTVTGVCLLLHSSVVAVVQYREYREEQDTTVTRSILGSAADATSDIFYCSWYDPNTDIYRKLSLRTFTYTMYTLQCVVLTTLWLESNTHGTVVWYYVVPAVPVLLYILYVPLVLLRRYFVNKRITA